MEVLSIKKYRCFPLRLDFRMGVEHGLSSRNYTENVFVEIESEKGIAGYGECVPRDYVTGETVSSALRFIGKILPELENSVFENSEQVIEFLDIMENRVSSEGNLNRASFCAIELALLDLAGKTWNKPVVELLGLSRIRDTLFYSLVIPLIKMDQIPAFFEIAKKYDFEHIKVKVDAENPGKRVKIIRDILGNGAEIRVDANCSWNRENASKFFSEMADNGVVSVEQPFEPEDLDGMAELKRTFPVSITLDESAWTVDSVRKAAEKNACDIINVRISKCGGLIGALNVIKAAKENGLGIQMGAHVGESCILSSAGAQLAMCIADFRWIEGFFGKHLLVRDICREDLRFGRRGEFVPNRGAGLGVTVDSILLA